MEETKGKAVFCYKHLLNPYAFAPCISVHHCTWETFQVCQAPRQLGTAQGTAKELYLHPLLLIDIEITSGNLVWCCDTAKAFVCNTGIPYGYCSCPRCSTFKSNSLLTTWDKEQPYLKPLGHCHQHGKQHKTSWPWLWHGPKLTVVVIWVLKQQWKISLSLSFCNSDFQNK